VARAESGDDYIHNMSRPTTKKYDHALVRAFRRTNIFLSDIYFPQRLLQVEKNL